jgi:hypothetical protein
MARFSGKVTAKPAKVINVLPVFGRFGARSVDGAGSPHVASVDCCALIALCFDQGSAIARRLGHSRLTRDLRSLVRFSTCRRPRAVKPLPVWVSSAIG